MKTAFNILVFILCQNFLVAQIDHFETIVYASDEWMYIVPTEEVPSTWTGLNYDSSDWSIGQGSIGYGDGDDVTIIPSCQSVYMRKVFEIVDKEEISWMVFHADYDDGFVAYLNGVEIARSNMAGANPSFDEEATELREAEMYSGGLPEEFSVEESVFVDLLNDGMNVLTIQTHNYDGTNSSDLSTLYWLSAGLKSEEQQYGELPSWFFVNNWFQTKLPIVRINTFGEEIPDEPAINAIMEIVYNGPDEINSTEDSANEFSGNISIEKRGNSSQSLFPKNNFGIETKNFDWSEDLDTSFLNFPTEEDWVFHGPYSDKTLLRNVLSMKMARDMDRYASRTEIVELFVNDAYWGIYVIMEKIKRDKNRVDIATLNTDENEGDDMTGGYILRIDWGTPNWYSQYNFANNANDAPGFQVYYPNDEELSLPQEEYIRSYVDSFENAMASNDHTFAGKHYSEYIDVASFIDRLILNEVSKNVDGYRLSEYFHKDKESNGGKLKAGPVWDFNLAFGNADYCPFVWEEWGWIYEDFCVNHMPFWWREFFTDASFVNQLNCRWKELRQQVYSYENLENFIDAQVELLKPALERNFARWPILDEFVWPNPVVTGSYTAEIENLKNYLSARLSWMDDNMPGTCISSNNHLYDNFRIKLFPNPSNGIINIDAGGEKYGQVEVKLFNALGHLLDTREVEIFGLTPLDFTGSLIAGNYFLQIQNDQYSESFRIVKI